MKKRGLNPMTEEPVNVTPLIDVVMCLIIFFLLCGQFAKDDLAANIHVPVAKYGQEVPEQRGRVVVNVIMPENYLEALTTPGAGHIFPSLLVRGRNMPYADLTAFLRSEVAQDRDVKVMLRASKEVEYQDIAPILVSCAQANIKSVHFSTVLN